MIHNVIGISGGKDSAALGLLAIERQTFLGLPVDTVAIQYRQHLNGNESGNNQQERRQSQEDPT